MRQRRHFALLMILILAALPAIAAPNFSGTWKLNVSKSDFGQMPAPDSMTRTITHEDPKLKSVTKQSGQNGEFEYEQNYTTDGKECTNEMFNSPIKSTLKWEGDTLVISSKGQFGDNEVTIQEKWTLSEDGKTLLVASHFSSSRGEGDWKLTLEKQ
jgi:hypothetical protein